MDSDAGSATGGRLAAGTETGADVRAIARNVAAQVTVAGAIELLASGLADLLRSPLALLSSDFRSWKLEAHAFPARSGEEDAARGSEWQQAGMPLSLNEERNVEVPWTAIALGSYGARKWAMLLPGRSEEWTACSGFAQVLEALDWSLGQVANQELVHHDDRQFQRRLWRVYAPTRSPRDGDRESECAHASDRRITRQGTDRIGRGV